ncbi:MAG TPA: bifunctional serine/threonine-protein kinase/formylglycine-generating enzyme family protein [Candidatus Hydrogenedentes bacterium]|nr:bifunctional serine/threonine-protein kinase/formylglycine-generating enzyme family protein [Candidatus Hydrogenedentota bacterium]
MVPRIATDPKDKNLVFEAGERISDRYEIEEFLGRGGMGVVYRARDHLTNEIVALKFMIPDLLKSQKAQQLFIQEAQVARRLRHENIVAVHDVSTTPEGVLYLSMEFLSGQSLRAMLRKYRTERRLVDVRLAVHATVQILKALEYAHRTVIHRDIKPENAMMLPGEHIKVLDFGLAKAVDEEAAATGDAKRKRVIGTTAYASPEQKACRQVDLRADLYSTGLMFYELLTLRTPTEESVEVAQARSDVAPSLITILNKALRAEPAERWQTAGDFRAQLTEAYQTSYRRAARPQITRAAEREVSTEGMVYMEGGSFLMGNDVVPEESPAFEAHVAPFYIDIHPITNDQFREFLKATGYRKPEFWGDGTFGGGPQPVVGVSLEDAMAYAEWTGKQLPTEAQWEFAARGKDNRKYPWGNREPDPMLCNYGDMMSMPSIIGMHDEGRTPEGVHDLAGNVYEWTTDYFMPYQPGAAKPKDPAIPRYAVRGGCWNSTPDELRCAFRKGLFPEERLNTVGFRLVLPAEEDSAQ